MYILANTKIIPGILVNLIVTVNSKYTFYFFSVHFLYRINILWNFIGSIQSAYSEYSVFYLIVNFNNNWVRIICNTPYTAYQRLPKCASVSHLTYGQQTQWPLDLCY